MERLFSRLHQPFSEKDFELLYSTYRDMYINIAFSYVHDTSASEDIVSESFIRLWEKRDEVRTGTYESFMFKIVVNRCLNHLRAEKILSRNTEELEKSRKSMIDFEIKSLSSCDPVKVYESEVMEIFQESIAKMPDITRRVFTASRFESLTYEEISAKMHIPVRKVTAEMQAALKFLRSTLKDYLPTMLILILLKGHTSV